jgi:extracellular elastinolytic metalloproteinase
MNPDSTLRKSLTIAALLLAATATTAVTAAVALSAPSEDTAADARSRALVAADLSARAGELGLLADDVADVAVTDLYASRHNGLTHVYLRQRVNGLEVAGSEMNYSLKRSGEVFTRVGSFVPNVAARAAETAREPTLTADEAVLAAASALGLAEVDRLDLLYSPGGADRAAVFANQAVSEVPIPARLRYYRLPASDSLRLVWNLSIKVPAGYGSSDWWDLEVDATSGAIVGRANWTADAIYSVFPLPQESPDDGPVRTDLVDPNDPTASPFGWHDTNGVLGPEFTVTRGNNVSACVDADANNSCDAGSQPDGTAALDFTGALVPLNLPVDQPAAYKPAAVVNLFYWNNIMHDVSYQYGYDEPAGNFQANNYGNGGAGNDAVNADAQDGSELATPTLNNANFSTPPDGSPGRMQMFRWTAPVGLILTGTLSANYPAGTAEFGATTYNLTAAVELAVDADVATPNDACCALTNTVCTDPGWTAVSGKIAIVRRGNCEFGTKAMNMSNAGALGTIIVNNQGEAVIAMGAGVNGGTVPTTFPVLSVGISNGDSIINALPGVNATMDSTATVGPDRDSDLDNGVIAHEYGHGISNRLTGGPANVGCLQNVEQMGEGWSDWQTLFLHASVSDVATTPRTIGGYVTFEPPSTPGYVGIRRYPYTTDNVVNPLTYAGVGDTANTQPHGIGTIWATILWEAYWNLVALDGYDPDVYFGSGGNNAIHQLVIDGMKLQPCSPSFVSGRDAILSADVADYDGDHECALWDAFAERGLGTAASTGASTNDRTVTESFLLPAQCGSNYIFSSSFGHGDLAHWSLSVP